MNPKLMDEANSLSLFLRNRAGAVGELNDYDKELLRDSSRVIDELSGLVKRLSEEYIEVCDGDCTGDISVGIPGCPFYWWPDIDDGGHAFPGGCELKGAET